MIDQASIERTMLFEGMERAKSKHSKALEIGRLGYTKRGRGLLHDDVVKLDEWIANWRMKCEHSDQVHRLERQIYDAVTANNIGGLGRKITLKSVDMALVIVDLVVNRLARATTSPKILSTAIGEAIHRELVFRALTQEDEVVAAFAKMRSEGRSNGDAWRIYAKAFRDAGYNISIWNSAFKTTVGGWFLEAYRIATGHIYSFFSGKDCLMSLTTEVWEYVKRSNPEDIGFRPRFLPCLERPQPWTSFNDGGFSDPRLALPFITSATRKDFEYHNTRRHGEVMTAANILAGTAWTPDETVVETFSYFTEKRWERAGLAYGDQLELPEVKAGLSPEELKQVRALRHFTYKANRENLAKFLAQDSLRRLVNRFTGKTIYFVYQADRRGRLYARGDALNPQASEAPRAMLVFKEAEPVTDATSLRWLKIHGANVAGQDKLTLDARAAWVDGNMDMIRAVAEDHYECKAWEDMDKPFAFLGWCRDFVGVVDRGEPSRTPVSLDGSNNGLQLFSLLLRDETMARSTNLSSDPYPHDIYQEIADGMAEMVRDDDAFPAVMFRALIDEKYGGKVPRAMVKRPVMTKNYGVTKHSVRGYLFEWLAGDAHVRSDKAWRMASYLTRPLWNTMERQMRGAAAGMKWLRDSVEIVIEAGNHPSWMSPAGFPVCQPYVGYKFKKVRLVFGKVTFQRSVMTDTTKVKILRKKTLSAIAPNFVHSLDAAVAARVAVRMQEKVPGCSLRWIFDSFATHARHTQILSETIREVIREMFAPDLLSELKTDWEDRYKVELPELPAYGNYDLDEILKAEYAFS